MWWFTFRRGMSVPITLSGSTVKPSRFCHRSLATFFKRWGHSHGFPVPP